MENNVFLKNELPISLKP